MPLARAKLRADYATSSSQFPWKQNRGCVTGILPRSLKNRNQYADVSLTLLFYEKRSRRMKLDISELLCVVVVSLPTVSHVFGVPRVQ